MNLYDERDQNMFRLGWWTEVDKSLEEYKELIINSPVPQIHYLFNNFTRTILNNIELKELIDYCSDLLNKNDSEISKRIIGLGAWLDPKRYDHKKIIYKEYLYGDSDHRLRSLVLYIIDKEMNKYAEDQKFGIIIAKAYKSAIDEKKRCQKPTIHVL